MPSIRKKQILSLLLCTALLFIASAAPLQAFASLEEEGGYEDEEAVGDTTDDSGTEGATDTVADDEPVDSGLPAAVSSAIQDLEAQIAAKNTQLENIQREQERLQAQRDSARTEKEKAEVVRNNVGYQITLTQDEISGLEARVALLGESIELKQDEIWRKQDEIDVKYELFKTRIRAKYMQDNGTVLGLLVGADSFADFLTTTEYTARVAEYDRNLMTDLTKQRKQLELDKVELEENKVQVEEDKALTESKKQDLSQQYTVAAAQVQDYNEMEQTFLADLEKNKAMQATMKAEIDKLYQEIEFSKNPYVGGEMAWPLPGFTLITSQFGSRFGGSDYHTGTDISGSGCLGSPVIAANDGQVAFVNTTYTQGVGYGKYILIDHGINDQGQSVSTLYAHLNDVSVSTGQIVSKGQTIGACGSTGWSTGPHLHFEVRLNGTAVNSLPYITAS